MILPHRPFSHINSSEIALAIAFESLFALEQSPGITEKFEEYILSLLGKLDRLDSWVRQFYEARSKIVHQGSWPHLGFYVTDKEQYREILKGKQQGQYYHSLTAYGRHIFRICWVTVLSGNMLANEVGLPFLLHSSQDRLEEMCKILTSSIAPSEKLQHTAQHIVDLNRSTFDEKFVNIKTVLGAGKLLLSTFLDTNPQIPEQRKSLLESLIDADKSLSEQEQLEKYEEVLTTLGVDHKYRFGYDDDLSPRKTEPSRVRLSEENESRRIVSWQAREHATRKNRSSAS